MSKVEGVILITHFANNSVNALLLCVARLDFFTFHFWPELVVKMQGDGLRSRWPEIDNTCAT